MAKYKVELTGVNTSELEVLSNEEQLILFEQMHNGDIKAKEKLINGNLKLVLSVLRKFYNTKANMDDLFQVGVIGLIKAIDNFDPSLGLRLSTYGIPLIVGEVKRFLRDNQSSVRVSRGLREFAYQILNYKEEFQLKNGIEPTYEEIANHFNTSLFQICNALDSLKEPVSIFEPIYNDGGEPIYLEDQLAANKEVNDDRDMLLLLKKSLLKLKERERKILIDRYIVGKTQMEIANMLNISQAQVSRIEKNAIRCMQRLMK